MNFEFKKSFLKDLKKRSNDKIFLSNVQAVIKEVDEAEKISDVNNVKKLKGEGNYYRIRFGSYRIGLMIEDNTAYFVRALHRSDIYKYFP